MSQSQYDGVDFTQDVGILLCGKLKMHLFKRCTHPDVNVFGFICSEIVYQDGEAKATWWIQCQIQLTISRRPFFRPMSSEMLESYFMK